MLDLYIGRSYLVPTPLLLPNYWFDPNKSDVIFEIFVFSDKSMLKDVQMNQYVS